MMLPCVVSAVSCLLSVLLCVVCGQLHHKETEAVDLLDS